MYTDKYKMHPSTVSAAHSSQNRSGPAFVCVSLFLAALGLRCCAWASSSCSEQGLLFLVVLGFSLWGLLLLQGTGSRARGLSNCDPRAQLLHSIWNPSGPVIKPVFPALADRFLATVASQKSQPLTK